MDSETFRKAGHAAVDFIAEYYENIASYPVQAPVQPGYLRRLLPSHGPNRGEPWEDIDRDLKTKILRGLSHWAHPGYMAYLPASSTFEGILGELYSAAFNNPAFAWSCSPAVTELENIVMDWLVHALSLPDDFLSTSASSGGGLILDSTTSALIVTMVAARERCFDQLLRQENVEIRTQPESRKSLRSRLVVLGSNQTHASTSKAAFILGVQYRECVCDPRNGIAMSGADLQDLIKSCKAEGLIPFYLTATLGTTNTCAMDDFGSIFKVTTTLPNIWVHVDAAYAGAVLICEEYRSLGASLRRCHSMSLNLGKWLLTNLDCTCLFVKERRYLTRNLDQAVPFLQYEADDTSQVMEYKDLQLSLGRRFRALKVWFVFRSWGLEAIRKHILHHVELGKKVASWVESSQTFRLLTQPAFALTVCTVSKTIADKAGMTPNDATLHVLSIVNASNEIWLTSTDVEGTVGIRILGANPKANEEFLWKAFCKMEEAAKNLPAVKSQL